jgi:hypothetical protein
MARRKTKPSSKRRDELPLDKLLSYSIKQFAELHGISVDTYFRMQRRRHGPVTMKVGHRTLISRESAEAWRHDREQATQQAEQEPMDHPPNSKGGLQQMTDATRKILEDLMARHPGASRKTLERLYRKKLKQDPVLVEEALRSAFEDLLPGVKAEVECGGRH